ncbi:MAG: hypothetical protein DRN64_00580 [Thaumarchaeota archaeon]|nr:MAG: hypothetical protein DRN64_00580 [Nitrososphaerota archaeon]
MRIVLITIGQSPREDVMGELRRYLEGVEYLELGLLDGLSGEEISSLKAEGSEIEYVTRLRSGEEVRVSRRKLEPLLERKLNSLRGVDLAIILCTGEFEVSPKIPLIYPWEIMASIVESLNPRKLGVIVPLQSQIGYAHRRWGSLCEDLKVCSWSPYRDREPDLRELADRQLVIMDCIGYSIEHEKLVSRFTSALILRARPAIGALLRVLRRIW